MIPGSTRSKPWRTHSLASTNPALESRYFVSVTEVSVALFSMTKRPVRRGSYAGAPRWQNVAAQRVPLKTSSRTYRPAHANLKVAPLTGADMEADLRRVNDLHLWVFEVARRGESLLILGSNDFAYYHYLEAEFGGVTFCDLPDTFSHAQFTLGQCYNETWSVWVTAESNTTCATVVRNPSHGASSTYR